MKMHRVMHDRAALPELIELHSLDLVAQEALTHDGVSAIEVSRRFSERIRRSVALRNDADAACQQRHRGPRLRLGLAQAEPGWNHTGEIVRLSVVRPFHPGAAIDIGEIDGSDASGEGGRLTDDEFLRVAGQI